MRESKKFGFPRVAVDVQSTVVVTDLAGPSSFHVKKWFLNQEALLIFYWLVALAYARVHHGHAEPFNKSRRGYQRRQCRRTVLAIKRGSLHVDCD